MSLIDGKFSFFQQKAYETGCRLGKYVRVGITPKLGFTRIGITSQQI